uniref:Protein FAM160B1 n=1 Tax=Phallusia mammillata TaxID=59560 RepID=A0A6F9DBU8_9ASCI|nr:protein FAM160B1 [Phallusia mammillata]
MFNKFTTILQQAVEALAPDAPLHEDFVYHWKSVTNFYIENTDDKTPVSDSNIPSHLKQMLQILIQEEDEREAGDTGPCMEYLLQHKILETLHTLGRADCPPGMKQQVLIFFKNLLGKIKQPLLPHINVHRPVSRLVQVCGEVQAAPTEVEEISFLCTVCARLKREPHLINFFLGNEQAKAADKTKSPTETNHVSESSSSNETQPKEGYDLVDSLLNLSRSEDGRVAVKACEGLLLLVSTPHEAAARATVQDTALCPLLNTRLTNLFTALPTSLDPTDVDCVTVKWGLDSHSYSHSDARNFVGKRALVSFLSWFDYCDQLVMEAFQDCGDFIAQSIAENFFAKTLLGPLVQADERASLTTTAVLAKLFSMVRSKALTRKMINFVVGESQSNEDSCPTLLTQILSRCDHFSDEISIVTLRLFEVILFKPDSTAIDSLILRYLKDRAYHAKNPGNVVIQSSDELEWELEPGLDNPDPNSPTHSTPMKRSTSNTDIDNTGEAPNPKMLIQRSVNCFLSVLPDTAKSTQVNDDESGYDGYLREAHRTYKEICSTCREFDWPKPRNDILQAADRCQPVAVYNEGPFLTMLFNKLSSVLSQPYAVNLIVTSLASRLCLVPHPLLQELFANPLTPLRPKARSIFSVLQGVVEQITHRMVHVPNFKQRLLLARRKLAAGNEDDSPAHKTNSQMTSSLSGGPGVVANSNSDDHRTFLEGAIVLEEFCKELAAIAFVKHHAMAIHGL